MSTKVKELFEKLNGQYSIINDHTLKNQDNILTLIIGRNFKNPVYPYLLYKDQNNKRKHVSVLVPDDHIPDCFYFDYAGYGFKLLMDRFTGSATVLLYQDAINKVRTRINGKRKCHV